MRTRLALLLAAIAGLAVGSPAAVAAAARPTCGAASKAHGAKVIARSGKAVVFSRGQRDYGCVYGSHKVRRYSALCCENVEVDVGGRYMAYTYTGTAIGDESSKLGAYDLRSGKRVEIAKLDSAAEGGGGEIDTGGYVPAFVVSRAGAVAWLQTGPIRDPHGPPAENRYELRAGDGDPRQERIVDSGRIEPQSLRLRNHGRSVEYRKDGVVTSVPLRR